MANSLTYNHTMNDIRNKIGDFYLLIKQVSNNNNNSQDTDFKEQFLILYKNQKNVDDIPFESYFYDSIPIS